MNGDGLYVGAMYNPADDFPYVELSWGPMRGHLTTDEARTLALHIITCANDAEQNAFLVDFLVEKLGHPSSQVGQLLQEFKQWREQRQREGK